jgi:flavin-dependent dehydrogenase
VVEPESINFRRWEDGNIIGFTKLIPDFRQSFDAPYYVVHRAHFHNAMYKLAKELGVEVVLDAKICNYDAEAPTVELENGQTHKADLIIAADGKSQNHDALSVKVAEPLRHKICRSQDYPRRFGRSSVRDWLCRVQSDSRC